MGRPRRAALRPYRIGCVFHLSKVSTSTSIPIPDVFSWDLSRDSPVGVPYHLEAFVEGIPLSERWTNELRSDEGKRTQLLRSLAQLMSQLHALQFDKIGMLAFDSAGKYAHVEEMVQMTNDYDDLFAGGEPWITRDWDPAKYGYGQEDPRDEDSPEQLLRYRREYAAALAGMHLPEADSSADDTMLSQILEAIEIAIEDTVLSPLNSSEVTGMGVCL